MCLMGTPIKAWKKTGYAWKAFVVNQKNGLETVYHQYKFGRGRWQRANNIDTSKDLSSYLGLRIGFHGFKTERGAREWAKVHIQSRHHIILRCRYRGATVEGDETIGGEAVVFKEIYIPRTKKRKPRAN
jgi:hypothetical protein